MGKISVRNYGERLPFRGGNSGYGPDAGLFALTLIYLRSNTDGNIGFRPAFVS